MVSVHDCDKEPIHIPQAIQPHGYMLVLDIVNFGILNVSENFSEITGEPAEKLLGKSFDNLFGFAVANNLKRRVSKEGRVLMLISADPSQFLKHKFNCFVQTIEDRLILEFEENIDITEPSSEQTKILTDAVANFGQVKTIEELIALIPDEIRKLTGFGRVMLYQFDQSWNGEVISESLADGMDPYMHHHFPADDIPAQARDLYLKNTIRSISDSHYKPVALLGNSQSPLDMTYCSLRSVSAIHTEYLRNMNVRASMSISIVCNGKLWGLIACHHRYPKIVRYWLRSYCEVLGKLISLRISNYEDGEERNLKQQLQTILIDVRKVSNRTALSEHLVKYAERILSLLDAQGMAIVNQGQVYGAGKTPDDAAIVTYDKWLNNPENKELSIEENLRSKYQPENMVADASGIISMRFPRHDFSLHFFRPEFVRSLTWAGDPSRSLIVDHETGLHPRKSFETFKQTLREHGAPWKVQQIFLAQILFDSMRLILYRLQKQDKANASIQLDATPIQSKVDSDLRLLLNFVATQDEELQSQIEQFVEIHDGQALLEEPAVERGERK